MTDFLKTVGGHQFMAKLETFMKEMPIKLDKIADSLDKISDKLGNTRERLDAVRESHGFKHSNTTRPPFRSDKLPNEVFDSQEELENAEAIHDEVFDGMTDEDFDLAAPVQPVEEEEQIVPFTGKALNIKRNMTEEFNKSLNDEEDKEE